MLDSSQTIFLNRSPKTGFLSWQNNTNTHNNNNFFLLLRLGPIDAKRWISSWTASNGCCFRHERRQPGKCWLLCGRGRLDRFFFVVSEVEQMASTLGPAPDPEAVLRGHRAAVNVVTFHSPSGTLLSGDADGELKIWDLRRHRPLSSSRVHTPAAGVIGISAADASNKILSQGRDGTVKCWQLTESMLSRQPLLTIKTDSYHFCKLSLSESATMSSESEAIVGNTKIASGAAVIAIAGKEPSIIELWDIGSGKCVQKLPQERLGPSTGMCMSLQMCPWLDKDGLCTLVAGYEDGTMMVWDIRHAAAPLIQARLHDEPVLSIAIDRIGAGGVSGSADGNLMFFFLDYQENTFVVKKKVEGQAGIGDIAIRGDDKLVATAGWDHRIRIYDYKRRKPLAILKYHTETVTGVTFREDMKWMATSSRDSTIALWSLYPPSSLQQNQQLVNSGGSS